MQPCSTICSILGCGGSWLRAIASSFVFFCMSSIATSIGVSTTCSAHKQFSYQNIFYTRSLVCLWGVHQSDCVTCYMVLPTRLIVWPVTWYCPQDWLCDLLHGMTQKTDCVTCYMVLPTRLIVWPVTWYCPQDWPCDLLHGMTHKTDRVTCYMVLPTRLTVWPVTWYDLSLIHIWRCRRRG